MSCVIVNVCSALLVAMNHVTLYIVYTFDFSDRERGCYVHAHACPLYMYVCARVCVRVRAHVRLYAPKSLRLLCVLLGVRMCARNTQPMCLRVHITVIRARRGAMDSEMERSSSYEPLSLPSLVVQHNALRRFIYFFLFFLLFFFRSIGLRAFA